MYNNTIPFGPQNFCGPIGGSPINTPFTGVPFSGVPFSGVPFSGVPFTGQYGMNTTNGLNSLPFYGSNNVQSSFGLPGYSAINGINPISAINGMNCGIDCCTPFGLTNSVSPFLGAAGINQFGMNPLTLGQFGQLGQLGQFGQLGQLGLNNWSLPQYGAGAVSNYGVPFAGYGQNAIGAQSQFASPIQTGLPIGGFPQTAGFPGMNWNSVLNGCSTPWTNWAGSYPVNNVSPFAGVSPISGVSPINGVSNWFGSPWMGYAYPQHTQQQGVNGVNGVKTHGNVPVNGQYIPTAGYPFPVAPFGAQFPVNSCVPAGQTVNCEAA